MSLDEARARWIDNNSALRKAPHRATEDDITIRSLYTSDDVRDFNYERDLGFPGEPPFTRHAYSAGYLGRYWQMRLYSGFGNAEDTNKRWKFLLASGNDGVSAAFDLPTQLGIDSDDPSIRDEIGRVGVAIDTFEDFRVLFDGIPVERVPVSMNIVDAGIIMIAMLVVLAQERGIPLTALSGSLSNDHLTEYAARGTWHFPPLHSLRLQANVTTFAVREMPRFYPMNVRGILLHESSATAAQEVGIIFANTLKYIDTAIAQGATIDEVGPRVSFFFGAGSRIFETAAKFRAARRLWHRIVSERYRPNLKGASVMRFTSTFGGHWYRTNMAEINLVRAGYGVLGCVLGGTQGMILGGYDEAYALPTERTARLALMTQQICAEETDATSTIDPLAGSYFVEALTDELERQMVTVMDDIERRGGAVAAVESGYIQGLLADRAYRVRREEEDGQRIVVGVNKYRVDQAEPPLETHRLDDQTVERQIERLRTIKASRDQKAVEAALRELESAAVDPDTNLVQPLVECVRSMTTVGEMIRTLAKVFGEFNEPAVV
jgi:methylmalonyl-CoA mutase, N-terminal domain